MDYDLGYCGTSDSPNKLTPTMKRRLAHAILLAALLFITAATLTTPAHAQLGIGAGYNYDQIDDIRTSSLDATFDNSTGYHVGLFFDAALGPFAFRPGVFYRKAGTYAFAVSDESSLLDVSTEEFDLTLIEIPLDVRYRILPLPLFKPYVFAGPVLSFPQSNGDLEEGLEDLYLTADIGAGVELTVPGLGFTLMPELRYGIGTTRFIRDEFEIGGTTVSPQESPRMNSVMLRLNLRF